MVDRKKLREEINEFFEDEASLNDIFFFNNEIFGDNFYQNLPGTNYRTKVRSLISELERRNLTHKFIKVVSEEYPNFAKEISQKEEILQKEKQWQDLCKILSQINNTNLIKIAVCRAFEPKDIKNIDPELAGFKTLSDFEKIKPILKTNLLKKGEKSPEGFPVIFKFACCLSQIEEEEIKTIREDLQHWINEVAQQLNIQDYQNLCQPQQTSSQENDTESVNYYSLMITMLPKSQKKYYIHAELISENQINSPNKEKPIYFEKDKICGECSFESLPEKISQLIYAINKKYLYRQAFELTIELFLPLQDLDKAIDLEEVCNLFDQTEEPQAIGSKYRFILRSIDRYNNPENHNKLILKWTRFHKSNETNSYLLNQLNENFNKKELIIDLDIDNKNTLSMTCSLSDKIIEMKDFFEIILKAGIPVFLWTRCNNLTEIDPENQLKTLLEKHCLDNLNKGLINDVFNLRRKAHAKTTVEEAKQCLGYHLGILCDYPERLRIPNFVESLVEFGS